MKLLYIVILLSVSVSGFMGYHVDGARILTIFPNPAKSHWFALKPLFMELTKRGHNITLLTAVVEEDFPPEWEVAALPNELPKSHKTRSVSKQIGALELYDLLLEFGLELCEKIFSGDVITALLNTKEKTFDLFMMEYFNHNCFLAVAHKFDTPVIGFSAFGGFTWTIDTVGDPFPLSHFPDVMVPFTDRMTFWQRLMNVFMTSYARYFYSYYFIPKADRIVKKHLKDPTFPSISTLEANTSLILLQTHISYSYPRPHLPNVIETGGMHTQKLKPLPEDLQRLLDSAKDGVIFFSMGTLVSSEHFPEEKLREILSVFGRLKETVLWKWDSEVIPGKPNNVVIRKWFPQLDLLAHKNLRLFISHGGLQSSVEAISCGVPVIGLPTMSEQKHNVQRAVESGYAVSLDINNITEKSFEWAVREVLENPKYRENAALRSRLFHDRPQSGVDTAVYWTEYVLRHKGAPHLRSAALDLSWYQLLLIDIIGFLLLSATIAILTVYFIIKKIYTALMDHCSLTSIRNEKINKNA